MVCSRAQKERVVCRGKSSCAHLSDEIIKDVSLETLVEAVPCRIRPGVVRSTRGICVVAAQLFENVLPLNGSQHLPRRLDSRFR